jgi:alanine-glyoxylate transaminase/(R)-3-amino-2-methylpropionate-pyruvate transaminase
MKVPQLPAFDHVPQPYTGPALEEVIALRREFLSPALLTYYQDPLMIVQGSRQYVYDEKGRRYLDVFGGIVSISVGHCHPYVLQKAREQMELLQHATTIYLHPVIAEYGRELAAKLPAPLKVCYFVNSGSEANDLALLLARVYTGNFDVIALRNAYHGGVASSLGLTAHSTWKFNVPHGFGVHHALNPDPYRGPWPREDPQAGAKYAADVQDLIDFATPGRVAAFIAESIQGVGGAVVYPDGYLTRAYAIVRQAGGVCIADEVQTGFGRTGRHYWGFENQGVVPDIVTLAKGIGNGAPLAAVVTTPEIAAALTRRHHFNTFGGNPVSCAMGRAVLEVIDREGLQQKALDLGAIFQDGLRELKSKHPLVGDVRGIGLMLGVELVKDRATKEPAKEECKRVMERAKDLGLLVGRGGYYGNVIRIKPPLCINGADVEFALEVLDLALSEV